MFRNHVCLTFPLASINLYDLIKRNHFKGLSLRLIRRFAQQIVTGLAFLHIQGVCHADMVRGWGQVYPWSCGVGALGHVPHAPSAPLSRQKPENVLLRHPNRSGIDIIDLGSSLFEGQIVYTYIQSRFYRAPEVIMGVPYGRPIDMW